MRKHYSVPGYVIEVEQRAGNDYVVDFRLMENYGCAENPIYNGHLSSDIKDAEHVASGTVKWDGCVDWSTTDGNCAHSCGLVGLGEFSAALQVAFLLAHKANIHAYDFDDAPDGLPAPVQIEVLS